MDTADLTKLTNGNFVQAFVLTKWADLYDLSLGKFFAQMRIHASDHAVLYQWSTDNGRIDYTQTMATGSIAFTLNPSPADTILLGSTLVTFVASGAVGNEVNIGLTKALTMAALLSFLNASVNSQIVKCFYDISSSSILQITFKTAGTLGNAFAIDASGAGTTLSNPDDKVLTGGGALITLSSPVTDIEEFLGDYEYDIRFQVVDSDLFVPLVGGILTFVQGVTRDTEV